jgi:pSer/pThr/pTyr-binding forkhead associated (FHA) protein
LSRERGYPEVLCSRDGWRRSVQLQDFVKRFEALSDEAFAANFGHPFLLETGAVLDTGPAQHERSVFLLRPRGDHGLVIGRAQSSDLRLNVENVSNRHAVLLPPQEEGTPWALVDTNSTNGTFLEGVRLPSGDASDLEDSVAIRFGPAARFTFLSSASFLKTLRRLAKEVPEPTSEERAALGQTDPNLKTELAESNSGQVVDESLAEILLHSDHEGCDPLPIRKGDTIVIGRTPKHADVVLPHKNVSRKHAQLRRTDKGVFIRDLGSSNGTFVGSTRVGPKDLELLLNKSVGIGPYTLYLSGPEEALGKTSVIALPDRPLALKGSLAEHPVKDLLNEIELAQLTGLLKVEAGDVRGVISFRAGEPLDARTRGGLSGDEALRRMFVIATGEYWLDPDAKVSEESRTISRSFAEFALEAFFLNEGED